MLDIIVGAIVMLVGILFGYMMGAGVGKDDDE